MIRSSRNLQLRLTSGFTLIELMVVLSLLAMILGGTLMLVSLIRRSGDRANQEFQIRQEFRRFAGDLRRDVRQSNKLTLDVQDSKLILEAPEKSIEYRFDSPTTVTRVLHSSLSSVVRDQYGVVRPFDRTLQTLDDGQTILASFKDREKSGMSIQIMATLGAQP